MIDTLEIEKYITKISDIKILFNHLGRYFYAMKRLNINENDTVVDASTGQGYGAYNLSFHCFKIFGLDVNKKFINYAKKIFKNKNLEYMTYDEYYKNGLLTNKIICLETIEHMESNEIINYMNNLLLTLIPNGQIIISFPIGFNKPSNYNRFHLCEPSIDFVYKILNKKLQKITFEIDSFVNSYNEKTDYCFMRGIK